MTENNLSYKIKTLRSEHGLTLEQVAQQVGVGKSTVRKWETGQIANMRRDKIAKLAEALHTTPAYLMGWEEQSSSPKKDDELDEIDIQLMDMIKHLSVEQKRFLCAQLQTLIATQESQKEN